RRADELGVVRVDVVEGRLSEQLLGLVAEHGRHGRADVLQPRLGVDDGGDVERVLDQGAEARLAAAQRLEQRGGAFRDPALELVLGGDDTHSVPMSSGTGRFDSAQNRRSTYDESG